jgi:S1-C subfamily serine protease
MGSVKVILLIAALLCLTFDTNAQEYAGRGGWNVKDFVFRVQCRGARTPDGKRIDVHLGTAFDHKSGHVISADHVVDAAQCAKASGVLRLTASDGRVSPFTVAIRDPALDLVLLKPDSGFVNAPLPLASDDFKIAIGAQVSAWGYPSGYSGNVALLAVGHLAGVQSDPVTPAITRWVVNAAFNSGNSGGPLLETATPTVIGVVIQKLSPISDHSATGLKKLSESRAPESKTLALAMLDIARRSQMVIGHAVVTADLKGFLRRAAVE